MNKILVVDDEPIILELVSVLLTDEGYEVLCVESADDALEVLRAHNDIDLVVTDMHMPGKSGLDLISEARAEFARNIAFIITSGNGRESVTTTEVDLKDIIFLKKPLDVGQLLESVATALLKQS